ncbi:MAG TPA: amidohydrolase family protein [Terriglobales bacterium]|nr:amidohydrolase family protein [Terriglobales bacterium]
MTPSALEADAADPPAVASLPAKITDCHVHIAAFPDGPNGCHISRRMLHSPLFRFLLRKHDLQVTDPASSNQKYVEQLRRELARSRYIGKAILLGMDGVYGENGKLDLDKTDFLVSNDYVLDLATRYPNEFLPGVSINPKRRDAIEELGRCIEAGAALVKVLPYVQGFDPADRSFASFYKAMAYHRIPLLSHVGYEFSLIGKDQSSGDPNRLRVPLDEGVIVIAAHGCSQGLVFYEKFYPTLLELARRYPRFYTDLSALTLPNRFGMLLRLRRHPELSDRLLFGTDYPLAVFHFPCWGRVPLAAVKQIIQATNRFDKQYLILKALGIGFRSFDQIVAGRSV